MHVTREVNWIMGIVVVLAMAVVAAACSDSDTGADVIEEAQPEVVEAEDDVEANAGVAPVAEPETELSDAADEQPIAEVRTLGEADWSGLDEWTLGALGGIRFGVPPGYPVHHDADMVTIRSSFSPDSGRYDPTMVIALIAQSGQAQPITTIDHVTERAVRGIGRSEPTGTTLELFGEELEGWRFTLNPGLSDGPHYLLRPYPAGIDGVNAWQPLPRAELFLAEVDDGVLAVGWTARDDDGLAEAQAVFDRVAPTLELTGRLGGDAPLEPVPMLESPPIAPAELPADVEAFELAGQRLRPGTYHSANLGTAMTFTVDDGWWVQPNFPGWVVLSADESFGPGDRGLVMRVGADSIVPTQRAALAGEPIDIDWQGWIAGAAPSNILTDQSEPVEIGGASGIRFDFVIDPGASCRPGDPCEYALRFDGPFPPTNLRKGYTYRLWHLTEGVNEPITVIAKTPDASWLDVAGDFFDTVTFG